MSKLRILAAAYEAALGYDYCPDEDKVVFNGFGKCTEEETRKGGSWCHGLKRTEIAARIIEEIASLKDAQELLKTYNRWRRGEDVTYIVPSEIGKAIDKLTL